MAFNYAPLIAKAASLIDKFGRDVTFRRTSRTPDDPAKPWRGSASFEEVACRAVLVGDKLTGVPAREGCDQVLVAASAGILNFDQLVDGASVRHVESLEVLRPGDPVLIYIAQVKR